MLNTLQGNQAIAPNQKLKNTSEDGGHTGIEADELQSFLSGDPAQQQNFSPSKSDQLTMLGNGGFKPEELENIGSQSAKAESLYLSRKILNEEIVCDVSLISYLFENRDVTELNYRPILNKEEEIDIEFIPDTE